MDARVQDERRTIMEENQKLKGVLAQREHIKGLSDQNIQTTFKKLVREVDNFSRAASGGSSSSGHFPIPSCSGANNPKKLKQLIIQSSIWIILNDQIFQSPFAVFGDGGRELHREWNLEFGKG